MRGFFLILILGLLAFVGVRAVGVAWGAAAFRMTCISYHASSGLLSHFNFACTDNQGGTPWTPGALNVVPSPTPSASCTPLYQLATAPDATNLNDRTYQCCRGASGGPKWHLGVCQ